MHKINCNKLLLIAVLRLLIHCIGFNANLALKKERNSVVFSLSGENFENEAKLNEHIPKEVYLRRNNNVRDLMKTKRPSSFDLALDDFIGKRYGRGKIFYGERLSDLTEEIVNQITSESLQNEKNLANALMKPNAIFIVGATGGTGQWVTYYLLEKGFNVRIFARNIKKAENIFGPDGSNVDIVVGDVKDKEALSDAMIGCQAAVYCAGSRSIIGNNSYKQVDYEGVENFVEACQNSKTVKKMVLQSSAGVGSYARGEGVGGFGGGGQIGQFLNNLFGDPIGSKAKGEACIRKSALPYVIVRTAGLLDEPGGIREVLVEQGDTFGSKGIARMDAAEAIVESLLSETENVTFEVRNSSDGEGSGGNGGPRRGSSVEPDPDLMMVKYEEETEMVEKFWREKLAKLIPDK